MSNFNEIKELKEIKKIAQSLKNIEKYFTKQNVLEEPNWQETVAWRYRKIGQKKLLEAVKNIQNISLKDLKNIENQKEKILQNTKQFIQGKTANNVLLTGARGTGKSSLIRACLNEFSNQNLRLIEIDKEYLIDLSDIVDLIGQRTEKFIIYCDDLSFEEGEVSYKSLKSVLDGSISSTSPNVLIYATSNRRHLLPEYMKDNLNNSDEIHPSEVVEEKISLSERFGLWLSFYPFSQEEYLKIVEQWLINLEVDKTKLVKAKKESLVWALERGSRSGRVALQFARDFAGKC